MRLIPEWRSAWRMFSVQVLVLIGALTAFWQELPPEIVALLPAEIRHWVITGLALAGLVGRLIDQRTRE